MQRDLFVSAGAASSADVETSRRGTSGISVWLAAAAALVAGIVIGFASGYSAAQRPGSDFARSEVVEQPEPADATRPDRSNGQTFTEGAVGEAVRVEPEPIVAAPAQEPPAPVAERKTAPAAAPRPRPAARAAVQPPAARTAAVAPANTGPGSLQILSRPSGAQVTVDGRVVGRTPLVVADVGSGAHDIRLELAGFRGWQTSVQVTPGNRTRVAASLEQ